jgi:peroxiredoxin
MVFPLLLFIRCNRETNPSLPDFSFNDTTYLKFHVKNCTKAVNLNLFYNTIFPLEQIKLNLSFERDTVDMVKIYINHPVAVTFFNSILSASCFVQPEDTLDIYLDLSSSGKFKDNIIFNGKTESISYYLTNGKDNTPPITYANESSDDYNHRVDTLTERRLKALYAFNNQEHLPDWFVKMEETDIQYSGAYDKIYHLCQLYSFYSIIKPIPQGFINELGVKIDNPEAKYSLSYYGLLGSLSIKKNNTIRQQSLTPAINVNLCKESIKTANRYLHSEIREFYIAQSIGVLMSGEDYKNAIITNDSLYLQNIDSLVNYAKTNIHDTVLLGVLSAYQKKQFITAKVSESLKPGTLAPDFKLADLTGETVSLKNFKGQLICINFWATWCSPCIKSISEKNRLFYTYKDKGVVFINVCLDSNYEKWTSLIKENNFKGVHLICKGNWINLLYRSYHISLIPHYVLVDKTGNIIMNRVADITELENLIRMHI